MISSNLILDGESLEQGAGATGQKCLACAVEGHSSCWYPQSRRDWLHKAIYMVESGECDDNWKFCDRIRDQHWALLRHDERNIKLQIKKIKKHAGHELGAREFTLTYSPQWCDDAEARELMVQAVKRLEKYYSNELVELQVVGEVTKQGCSHVHGYYLLDGGLKMTDKNFKRAYKFWNPKKKMGRGFEGGHHEVVKTESDFKGYIDKCPDAWYKYSFSREKQNGGQTEVSEDG